MALARAVLDGGQRSLLTRDLRLVNLDAAKGGVAIADALRAREKRQQTATLQGDRDPAPSRIVCLNT